VPSAPVPGHGYHRDPRRPYQKQGNPYLVPLIIVIGLLAVGVPAGIIIANKLLQPPPPPAKTTVIIDAPQPGELYTNVKARDPAKPKPPTPPEE
jgi:hypothetical protein